MAENSTSGSSEAPPARKLYRFGTFEADVRAGQLRKNGVRLKLRNQPFEVLVALLERPGAVLSRTQLEEKLYGWDEEVGANAIEVYVHRLRKKVEAAGVTIRTIRGLGYLLEKDG